MSISGKISTIIRVSDIAPASSTMKAAMAEVYGRRSASRTSPIMGLFPLSHVSHRALAIIPEQASPSLFLVTNRSSEGERVSPLRHRQPVAQTPVVLREQQRHQHDVADRQPGRLVH